MLASARQNVIVEIADVAHLRRPSFVFVIAPRHFLQFVVLDETPKGWGRACMVARLAVSAEAIGLRRLECVGLRRDLLNRTQNLFPV